jgi:hypothetical protein
VPLARRGSLADAELPGYDGTNPEEEVSMPIIGDVVTFHQDGAWRNRVEGSGTTALAFPTMGEASAVGRAEAQRARSTHIVKDEAGRIVERTSYAV